MATTTNFNWETPDDTDLVKDGAAAIRTALNGVDTSFVDLKGGTSGQILSKASNADLDYTWVSPNPGDITGVAAGTGLTGGGTSGDVTLAIDSTVVTLTGTQTLTNKTLTSPVLTTPSISTIDAKGDLLVGTADNTIGRLAVGTNNQVLIADSSTGTGLKWGTVGGGGKVLQVVSATYNVQTTVASTSYGDTGLSLSITPSATTSKIMVLVTQNIGASATVNVGFDINLVRAGTQIWEGPTRSLTSLDLQGPTSILYLDSPSTTSATTYKTQMKCTITGSSSSAFAQLGNSVSMITLMEIGA